MLYNRIDGAQRNGPRVDESGFRFQLLSNVGSGRVPMSNVVVSEPSSVVIPPPTVGSLQLLKDVSGEDFQCLFRWKLHVCCSVFDFTEALKSAHTKEIKRQTLLEIKYFIQSGTGKIPKTLQKELIKMVSVNIFRDLPPSHANTSIEPFDVPPEQQCYLEPSWIHLQIVYEILLSYIQSPHTVAKVAKRYIDRSFVLNLLKLLDSEDSREREFLKHILHRIYGKFFVHRKFVRQAMNDIFYQFIYEKKKPGGIGELLGIQSGIIGGLKFPLREEHKLFLIRVLIPLHKPKPVTMYHQYLSCCIVQFVEKDYELADIVIRGLLKYWPVTDHQDELIFLDELWRVLWITQAAEFKRCMIPLFRRIACCLCSPHFMIAETAFNLWNNEPIWRLITENRVTILPIIFEALEKNVGSHWSEAIRVRSVQLCKIFQNIDIQVFEECQRQYVKNVARSKELEEQRALAWKKLAEAAEEHMVTD